jgi:hypothetical protein
MSKAQEFKKWCSERQGHPPQVKLALEAVLEMEKRIQSLDKTVIEEITSESVKAIINYIDEGEPDLNVVKGELGELLARHNGTYCPTDE